HTRFSRDWSSDVCSSDLRGRWHLQKCHPPRCPVPPASGPRHPAERHLTFVDEAKVAAQGSLTADGGRGPLATASGARSPVLERSPAGVETRSQSVALFHWDRWDPPPANGRQRAHLLRDKRGIAGRIRCN